MLYFRILLLGGNRNLCRSKRSLRFLCAASAAHFFIVKGGGLCRENTYTIQKQTAFILKGAVVMLNQCLNILYLTTKTKLLNTMVERLKFVKFVKKIAIKIRGEI